MAQAPRQSDGGADFIRQIVSDPKNVPDVMMLTGYLGDSSEEGHERLYLSRDLTNYVEIPKAAILHQAPLPKEQDAYGGVTVWVKKDAALQYKMAPAAQALANYFAGAIQAGAQAAAVAAAQPPVPPLTQVSCALACITHIATCVQHTCGATCAVTCAATCAVTCATTCAATCAASCVGTCAASCVGTCPPLSCAIACRPTEVTPCFNTHANTCGCVTTQNCQTRVGGCEGTAGACTYVGCGASLACTHGLLCAQQAAFAGQQQGGAAAGGFPAAAVRAAPQSIGGCGQSVGAACTAGDCSYLVPCQSQAGTCMPVQTCMPNVCTVDTVCCPTAFVNCPSNHATCAPNCTRAFPCGVSHAICGPSRFEPACQFATNAAACQIVASGPACPQVSLACPQQSVACGGFPGQPGFGGAAAFARNVGFTFQLNCSPAPWCHHTQWDICM